MTMPGSCACGGSAFDLAPGTKAHACRCETCRRRSGSASFPVSSAPDAIRFAPIAARGTADRRADGAEPTRRAEGGSTLLRRRALGPRAGWSRPALCLPDDAGAIPCGGEIRVDRNPAAFAFAGDHAGPTGTGAPVATDPD